VHLLVLTSFSISYCTEWKLCPVWGLCECSSCLHRSCKRHIIHTLGPAWRSHTSVDEDYALSTGEWLCTFQWNVLPSSWTVGPEGEGKFTSRKDKTPQMTWIFTNTAVRISPPTVFPKHRQETIKRYCVKSQNSADLFQFFIPCIIKHIQNNQPNALNLIFLFIPYNSSYMFRQLYAIIMEHLSTFWVTFMLKWLGGRSSSVQSYELCDSLLCIDLLCHTTGSIPVSAGLIYSTFEAWNHTTVDVLRFMLSACQENAQTEVVRVFSLLFCSRVWW
jgi:hypothetical protein